MKRRKRKYYEIVYAMPGDTMRFCQRVAPCVKDKVIDELKQKGWIICYVEVDYYEQ